MTICLTGMMGSGKSSVGRELSGLLSLPFVDLDSYIEEQQGCGVREIFAEKGEAAFRELERQALEKVLESVDARNGLVLALGGGTPTAPGCAGIIAGRTCCIYLKATPRTLAERLESEVHGRPMLAGGELRGRIAELLAAREPIYESTARHTVATDGLTVAEIAGQIAEIVRELPESQK